MRLTQYHVLSNVGSVKPQNVKWGPIYAKRLMQIKPLGGTPLAEVYKILQPTINSFKPDIFVTLTDGEPSDMDAVRLTVLSYKRHGIRNDCNRFGI